VKTIDGHGVRITVPGQAQQAHWAKGCGSCRHGLRVTPELNTTQPLYIARTAQAALGMIEFCDCQAGVAYRQYLRGTYQEERKTTDMDALQERVASESTTPTIHYEQAKVLA
jgi:hypothetical protein